MAANIVKCANCNVVIDELLAYIQNKVDIMDELSLVQLCRENFSEEEISKSKRLLFDSIPNSKRKTRKSKGKKLRDIEDMVDLLKTTEQDIIPIFVARELHKLPPITWDHLDATKAIKELTILQKDVRYLKDNCALASQLAELQTELDNLKQVSLINNPYEFVNNRRGACRMDSNSYYSDPAELSPVNQQTEPKQSFNPDNFINFSRTISNIGGNQQYLSTVQTQTQEQVSARSVTDHMPHAETIVVSLTQGEIPNIDISAPLPHSGSGGDCDKIDRSPTISSYLEATRNPKSMVRTLKPNQKGDTEQMVGDSDGWSIMMDRKKRRKLILSTNRIGMADSKLDDRFKAKLTKVPIYISNVCIDTTGSDIISYIKEKTQEEVTLYKINRKFNKSYNSYKLYVSKQKLSLFLDDAFWPSGITFRRFVHDKYYKKKSVLELNPN